MLSAGGEAALVFFHKRSKLNRIPEWTLACGNYIHLMSAEVVEGDEKDDDASNYVSVGISGTRLDDIGLVSRLKACTKRQDLQEGHKLHSDILQSGLLDKNPYVGNTLVNMYTKCGALASAQDLFDELRLRDVISWTALISGYTQHGHGEKALVLFEQMQAEGLTPDTMTFACILKACGIIEAAEKGKEIYAEVVKKGFLDVDSVLGNALLDMYVKIHALEDAQRVFDKLPSRNIVSWTMLIQGYCMNGHGKEALHCYEQMQHEGISPNALTFAFILKACGKARAAETGEQIHAEIAKKGLLVKNSMLGSALVDMYAKSGAMTKAQKVFEELPLRDKSSWTALVAGYCQHGQSEEALICFEEMQNETLALESVTISCLLHACSCEGKPDKGQRIHTHILREGSLGVFGNNLVDMYAKCGALPRAQAVFDEIPNLDVVSWTSLISGYVQHGYVKEALFCFDQMQGQGFAVDAVTFSSVLKACSSISAAEKGMEVHSEIARKGLLGTSTVLENALLDLYAKCGAISKAQEVFDELSAHDIVSWNTLIATYIQNGHSESVIDFVENMQQEGICPDEVTFSCILKACGTLGTAEKGEEIHAEIARQGLLDRNSLLGTALVDMYSKCGAFKKAQEVFHGLPVRGVVAWTALIEGYCLWECSEQAMQLFDQMQSAGLCPNAVTFLSALRACGNLGSAEKGRELHDKIVREGLLEGNSALGAALVDMYAKIGALDKAQQVFDELSVRNVVSWTALMAGYVQVGNHETVFKLFNKMVREGVDPNFVTFVILLNACSHLGLVDEGEMYFKTMEARYGIIPSVEHQTCMVDLLSRAGLFDKAMSMIKKMPLNCFPAWFTLLGASQKWGNVEIGRVAFKQVVRLNKEFDLAYLCMSEIYATAGMQEEANKIKALRVRAEAGKEQGRANGTDLSRNALVLRGLDWSPSAHFSNCTVPTQP